MLGRASDRSNILEMHAMRTRVFLPVLALVVLLAELAGCSSSGVTRSSSAAADSTGTSCTDNLQAQDGTPITFAYQVQSAGDSSGAFNANNASNAGLSIAGGFNGSEQVSAVVLVFQYGSIDGLGSASLQTTQNVSFTYDGDGEAGSWIAQVPTLPMFNYTAGGEEANLFFYQFAFSINGNWLTDPVSASHNFQFIPVQQAQGACTGAPNGFGN
jgi:hypothetical protein